MKPEELLDSWHVSGSNYSEFAARVIDITESTQVVDANTSDIAIFSVRDFSGPVESLDKLPLAVMCAPQVLQHLPAPRTYLSLKKCRENNVPEAILAETAEQTKLLLQLAGGMQTLSDGPKKRHNIFFTSAGISRDLAARARLAGEAVYEPTEERNAYIMSRYALHPLNIKAIVRTANNTSGKTNYKVFALPTANYCPIPQGVVLDILDALQGTLGAMHCEQWYMDHSITQLWASFPDKAKDIAEVYLLPDVIEPGILIETSDTGDCALRISAAWRSKTSRAIIGTYQHEHRGKFDAMAAVEQAKDSILTAYTKLPERLCELLTIDVVDPQAAIDRILHTVTVDEAVSSSRKRRLENVLGAKRLTSLIDQVIEELPGGPMTAYDITMLMMALPSRIEDPGIRAIIERAAGNVAFLPHEEIAKTTYTVKLKPAPKKAS